jgi:glutathione synthase/RimK-type ligase-like ATP-grasp enzyme
MKIAIHNTKKGFSNYWIAYCKAQNIPYKEVNCYDNDIIEQLNDCYALMWHHSHGNYKDVLFAKQLLFSLEQAGKKVFPDFNTGWHFDDKVGQKYLLESIGAPLVSSYVFYSKEEALNWAKRCTFPKVFKLRGGAGASNVKLIKTKKEANRIISKAFNKGFRHCDYLGLACDSWKKLWKRRATSRDVIKYLALYFLPSKFGVNFFNREKGYVYFQDFIPNNEYDIRVIVIKDKAFAIKRMVREDDFRASGSGNILYEKENFDDRTIALAFTMAENLRTQCIAFDFIYGVDGKAYVVEMSYGFSPNGYNLCTGYWTADLKWHEGKFNPYGWMVDLIKEANEDGE